jgi:hypothetical protein
MKSLPNIDKSLFHKREYVGYAHGVWRVTEASNGWIARHRDNQNYPTLYARTLEGISKALASQPNL